DAHRGSDAACDDDEYRIRTCEQSALDPAERRTVVQTDPGSPGWNQGGSGIGEGNSERLDRFSAGPHDTVYSEGAAVADDELDPRFTALRCDSFDGDARTCVLLAIAGDTCLEEGRRGFVRDRDYTCNGAAAWHLQDGHWLSPAYFRKL